jgi:hypothetical protein
MHIKPFRTLHREEIWAINWWTDHVLPDTREYIDGLIEYYNENAIEAGPNGSFCEITTAHLQRVEDVINDKIEFYIERIKDWASD